MGLYSISTIFSITTGNGIVPLGKVLYSDQLFYSGVIGHLVVGCRRSYQIAIVMHLIDWSTVYFPGSLEGAEMQWPVGE